MRRVKPMTREEMCWGLLWSGTAEQLIAAGVIDAEQLMAHCRLRVGSGRSTPLVLLSSGRYARVDAPRGMAYRMRIWERFSEQEQAEHDRRQQLQRHSREEREHWGTPSAARATAHRMLRDGQAHIAMAFNLLQAVELPHRFDADTRDEAAECLAQLQAIFEAGALSVAPLPQPLDAKFEAFLQAVTRQGAT